jgi:hypothetical protein
MQVCGGGVCMQMGVMPLCVGFTSAGPGAGTSAGPGAGTSAGPGAGLHVLTLCASSSLVGMLLEVCRQSAMKLCFVGGHVVKARGCIHASCVW